MINIIIILHGFLGMGDNWKTLAKQFSALGFELHLIDQRNHGRSFHDSEFNYEVLVSDLLHYCEYYAIKNCIVLGHSMGGKTAMNYAIKYPESLSKLVIADIGPQQYPLHHQDILKALYEKGYPRGFMNLDWEGSVMSGLYKQGGTVSFKNGGLASIL